jgi:hypothetical protein
MYEPPTFSLQPTGPDNTYRRSDYLRGFAECFGFAFVLFAVGALATTEESGLILYISFAAVLLGALSIGAALIFLAQAAIGSSAPLGFAVTPDFVPIRFRDPMRAILLTDWNPEQRPPTDTRAYERYLSPLYELVSYYRQPEVVVSVLEWIEGVHSLKPGSDPTGRLAAAQHIVELIYKTPLATPRA